MSVLSKKESYAMMATVYVQSVMLGAKGGR